MSNAVLAALHGKSHVVIHHSLTKDSGTVSWGAIRRYHVETQKWSAIGYHFGIEMVGDDAEILIGRMIHETAAAVKEDRMNRRGVHICVVGNFDETEPPPAVWQQAVRLTAFLCEMLEIPVVNVESHHRFAPYKTCPGKRWNMERFRAEVAQRRKTI